jgi:hypothetical protein
VRNNPPSDVWPRSGRGHGACRRCGGSRASAARVKRDVRVPKRVVVQLVAQVAEDVAEIPSPLDLAVAGVA